MSTPAIKLMSGIQTPIDSNLLFILDSSVSGILNTNILAGTVDSEFVAPVQSLTITRGRSRQLDRFNAGVASIAFYNRDRKLDPLNEASAYAGEIGPRLRMKILADNIPIFTGYVTDWNFDYDLTGNDVAFASCVDYFGLLSAATFSEIIPPASSAGYQIGWALEEFKYPYKTNLDPGNANIGAFTINSGTQLLDYLFQIAKSDNGKLFVDADGVVQYVNRFGRDDVAELAFSDDGTGVPYMNLINEFGDELLFNDIVISSPAGSFEVVRQDSIDKYGLSILSYTDLLNDSLLNLQDIANRLLEQFQFPRVRFTGLQVELAGLSFANRSSVLNLDLGDLVTVKRTFKSGSPPSVTQQLFVSGIKHRISADSHIVEFSFEPNPFLKYLRLDDATKGTINDVNVLG